MSEPAHHDTALAAYDRGQTAIARNLWEQRAALGDPDAQTALGLMLAAGDGGPANPELALHYWQAAADAGHADALYNLGLMAEQGHGSGGRNQAVNYYVQAASAGHPGAANNLAALLLEDPEQDPARAISLLEDAAALGDPDALFNLACLHARGEHVPRDRERARRFHRQAAEMEHPAAARELALLLEQDDDDVDAVHWLSRAADAGDAEAQVRLGDRHRHGQGVRQSETAAWNLYVSAARQGDPVAMTNIGVMYDKGRTTAENPQRAAQCYRFAAERNYAPAQYNLGILLADGIGVPADPAEGWAWFARAAAQGYQAAVAARDWLWDTLDDNERSRAEAAHARPLTPE